MKKLLLSLSAMALLTACGTTTAVTQNQLAQPIAKGQSRIIVERDKSLLYMGASATIKVNGQKTTNLGRGGSVSKDVQAGATTLEASAPFSFGQFVVRFDAKSQETYKFIVSPNKSQLFLGSAFGIAGDAVNAKINDASGYFTLELEE